MHRLTLLHGDITTARVDALVNAWNRNFIPHWLLIPQGVAGALRRRAGSAPFREVRRAGILPLGGLAETGPGRLKDVERIFHVAALHATWRSSERAVTLAAAEIFHHAALREVDSLAIPLLGAGTGGVDPAASFRILHDAWRDADPRPTRTELYVFDFDLYTELLTDQGWHEGFQHLQTGAFWDAHESWEAIWTLLPDSPAREAIQTLIQIAAACYKLDQAATRDSASMQRGMSALLGTAADHLAKAREPGTPQPGFPLDSLQNTLDGLTKIHQGWQNDTPLDSLHSQALQLADTLAAEVSQTPLLSSP